ncbi:MAG: DegT/DnrJ/EryC1/StrS family aminotransferase [Planctomycetia bacterium]|nr:DegT/DnrJ/EryC1/StrS family aminotransferase [Planctomycetia bacterium]
MIEFFNARVVDAPLSEEIQAAVARVLARGWYVLGPEVEQFEADFARYHGVAHAIGVANGTDAIELALRAAGIGPGDEVITVSHTAVPTVCAVERAGATPVLVDVDPVTYTMSPDAARAAITPRTKALLPVHLYGHPAELSELTALATQHGLLLVEDCAQAHGARYDGRRVGTFGAMGAFSFYPTKNLGGYGDGGAIITDDDALAARLRRLRNYGQRDRYHSIERGVNSRLDDLQAAILGVKLQSLDEWNERRRRLAERYDERLEGVDCPQLRAGQLSIEHVYHLYVVRSRTRDALRTRLETVGVKTQVHYPIPIHLQQAYHDLGYRRGSLPTTERLAEEILSLPLYPGLTTTQVDFICDAVRRNVRGAA